jgi:hypothetical protein
MSIWAALSIIFLLASLATGVIGSGTDRKSAEPWFRCSQLMAVAFVVSSVRWLDGVALHGVITASVEQTSESALNALARWRS